MTFPHNSLTKLKFAVHCETLNQRIIGFVIDF